MKRAVTIGATVVGLVLSSCGGNNEKATTSPAPADTTRPPKPRPRHALPANCPRSSSTAWPTRATRSSHPTRSTRRPYRRFKPASRPFTAAGLRERTLIMSDTRSTSGGRQTRTSPRESRECPTERTIRMADPIAVIIRFNGDADDLIERFERARQLWIEAQGGDYDRPSFYAACKSDEGIVILSGWETARAHRAFGHPMGPNLEAVGMGRPDQSSVCGSRRCAGARAIRSTRSDRSHRHVELALIGALPPKGRSGRPGRRVNATRCRRSPRVRPRHGRL